MTLRYDPGAEVTRTNGDGTPTREALEQRANLVLSELLRRLDVLDDRRQQLKSAGALVKYQVKRHLPLALLIGAGALAVGVVVARIVQTHKEREFRRQVTRSLLSRVVGDEVVEAPQHPSQMGSTLRQAGLRLLVLAGTEVGRRLLNRALEPHAAPRPLPARRAV